MASAHFIKNTSKPYVCTQCTSEDVSIIREDAVNPRLKCNTCQFLFSGKDSLAAMEAGAIKPSSFESLASASEPEVDRLPDPTGGLAASNLNRRASTYWEDDAIVPARPAYVFLTKDRKQQEFCTKRDFKKVAIKWSHRKFDVYELKVLKLSVKVDIS